MWKAKLRFKENNSQFSCYIIEKDLQIRVTAFVIFSVHQPNQILKSFVNFSNSNTMIL